MKKFLLFVSVLIPVCSFSQSLSDAVDLGLSVLWASHNIGASSCEQIGDLYAWGETSTKSKYTSDNYKYKDGDSGWTLDIGKEISDTQYDVAKMLWKGDWRMPTQKEFIELCKKCKWAWVCNNGVFGYEIKGPNGNTIFLPTDSKKEGHYWSGTLSQGLGRTSIELTLTEERFFTFGTYKTQGLMIRPVRTNNDYAVVEDIPEEWQNSKYSNLLNHINKEDYEQAFVEASVLAGAGDVKAQCVLASMFFYGAGTYRNYEAAQEQLALAAEQGSDRAEYMMGGFGSLEKKHEFMKALTGEDDSSDDVGFWNQMMSTETRPDNYKEAFRWFYLADGEWGYRDIMYYCGIVLITGAYGYKNQEHGLNWIIRSAKMRYSDAIQLLNKLSGKDESDED